MAINVVHMVRDIKSVFRSSRYAKIVGNWFGNVANGVASVTFTIGTEDGGDGIVVACQALDLLGDPIEEVCELRLMLFDDAAGAAINTDNYTITTGTDGIVTEIVADKILSCITEADGDVDIDLTIAGAASVFLLAFGPAGQIIGTSAVITHAA
jgi:hypothetical protein